MHNSKIQLLYMNMSGITMQSRNTFGIGEGYAFTMIIMTNIY